MSVNSRMGPRIVCSWCRVSLCSSCESLLMIEHVLVLKDGIQKEFPSTPIQAPFSAGSDRPGALRKDPSI